MSVESSLDPGVKGLGLGVENVDGGFLTHISLSARRILVTFLELSARIGSAPILNTLAERITENTRYYQIGSRTDET